jgi:hypothetical protein
LVVRLAYEQGLLQGKSISPYQRWALTYMMSYKRWFLGEVQESALKNLLFLLSPDRFREVYLPPTYTEPGGDGEPVYEDEVDAITAWLDSREETKQFSGADAPEPQWTEWQ